MTYKHDQANETKQKIKDLELEFQSLKKITLSLWITVIVHLIIHIVCDLINIFI